MRNRATHRLLLASFLMLWAGHALAASCGACFRGGWNAACNTCAGATNAAMSTISLAITASETTILAATGMVPPNPMVGFPALQDMVNGSLSQQTKSLVDVLDASQKNIVNVIQQLPANRVMMETNRKLVQAEILGTAEAGCRAADYGQASGLRGASSLASGWRWVQGDDFIDPTNRAPGDPISPSEGAAALNTNLDAQASTRIGQQLRQMRDAAGDSQASASNLLKPWLLLADSSRVLSDVPDDYGLSDADRMDHLIQLLNSDRPSAAPFLKVSASTPSAMKLAAREQVVDMESGLAMAVMDKLIKSRQKHPVSIGSEDYLRAVMADDDLEVVSDDDFTYLTSQYRAHDPQWIAKIDLSDEYAIKQYAQMEAEQLAHKYKRWVLKRDTNLLLSQIVANVIEDER